MNDTFETAKLHHSCSMCTSLKLGSANAITSSGNKNDLKKNDRLPSSQVCCNRCLTHLPTTAASPFLYLMQNSLHLSFFNQKNEKFHSIWLL